MMLPVRVYPALHVKIARRGGRAIASASGGDRSVLGYAWTLPSGRML